MKIAILGTRGIPNHYGGFEQFAELLSVSLVEKEHEVFVYNSENHPYKENQYKGVHIIHKYDPENKIGTIGQFVYDLFCILDSRKRDFDVILQLGYTSSSIWSFLFPKKVVIITNMDGLEWKRAKFHHRVQKFLMYAEKLAVKKSDHLVSDSMGIKSYLAKKYNVNSTFIAYGSEVFKEADIDKIKSYNLSEKSYNLLIARIEPENNIDIIIKAVIQSKQEKPLVVVGDFTRNKYGQNLYADYNGSNKIKFVGSIYNKDILNNLRYYSFIYFHGHTVGGTNPSLLEAMGCSCLIIAHKNEFNESVLGTEAYYFETSKDLAISIDNFKGEEFSADKVPLNLDKIRNYYNTNNINNLYEKLFIRCIQEK
jgi:glycosyltransferase involved in cell wall biosynthesis